MFCVEVWSVKSKSFPTHQSLPQGTGERRRGTKARGEERRGEERRGDERRGEERSVRPSERSGEVRS
eukprot:763053-Hanusia_phi.AAC.4